MSSTFFKIHNALLQRQQVISGTRDSDSNPRVRTGGAEGELADREGVPAIELNPHQVNDLRCAPERDERTVLHVENSAPFGSSDFDHAPDPHLVNGILRYVSGIPYLDERHRRLHGALDATALHAASDATVASGLHSRTRARCFSMQRRHAPACNPRTYRIDG